MTDILYYAALASTVYLGLSGVVAYANDKAPSAIAFGVLWVVAFLETLDRVL